MLNLPELVAKVDWNADTQKVTITKQNSETVLTIGEQAAKVNGVTQDLDVSAQLINNRTFVPLRFISENLGQNVDYNSNGQTITIS